MNILKKVFAIISYSTGAYLLVVQLFFPAFRSLPRSENELITPGNLGVNREEEITPAVFGATTRKDEYVYLTIPKLEIENARVKLDAPGTDPEDYIGHLSSTTYPGQPGISFLYGHSVLPYFFDPTDFNTIFSTLHELEFGDSFTIVDKKENLIHEVVYKITLDPKEVTPFMEGDYFSKNESFTILMTCTPPGLDTKRLLIIGKLRD